LLSLGSGFAGNLPALAQPRPSLPPPWDEGLGPMLVFEIVGGLFLLLLLAPIMSGHETVSR